MYKNTANYSCHFSALKRDKAERRSKWQAPVKYLSQVFVKVTLEQSAKKVKVDVLV